MALCNLQLIMQIGVVAYNGALFAVSTQGGSTTTVTVKKARTVEHGPVICGTTFLARVEHTYICWMLYNRDTTERCFFFSCPNGESDNTMG